MIEDVERADALLSEVLRNSLLNIVDNMENGMLRTAFSVVARDLRDVACGIHTPPSLVGADLVASAAGVPILSVVSHFGLKENLAEFGVDALRPGDELVFNDPFRGGNHAPDVTLARPVFDDVGLLGVCTTRSHWVDVGGVSPGSWPVGGGVRTVMEETSLRLPPVLLYREGKAVKSTHSLLLDGTRRPDLILGDLRAQHTANLIGERELLALARRYGRDAVLTGMRYTLDHGERLMRSALAGIGDGTYEAEDRIDDDGVTEGPFHLRARLEIRGGSAELDFSGSDRQTEGNSSSPWGMSAACALVALKSLVGPALPSNGGVFRCVDLLLPAGSLVHALPYQACADGNGTVAPRIASVVLRIANAAVPERAAGDHYGVAAVTNFGGYADPRPGVASQPWVFFHSSFSGLGATASGDGVSYVKLPLSNCMDPATEAIEHDLPVVVVAKDFTCDSGGPGEFRGGMGTRYVLGLRADGVAANSTDRVTAENFGAAGGRGSHRSFIERSRGIESAVRGDLGALEAVAGVFRGSDGTDAFLTGKFLGLPVRADDVWHKYVPGGGGWGDPLARDAAAVALDVQNELVSVDGAREDYGVVLRANLDVDVDATTALRERLTGDRAFGARRGPHAWTTRPLPPPAA